MKKTLLLLKVIIFFIYCTISAQNLVLNNDFETNGGSLDNWQYTSGTTLTASGGDSYATIAGENGVLYQKITNITPGLPYQCTMNFKSLVLKQTTGFGFAIEKGTPLSIPMFTIGATNLRDFCNNNSGLWTQLDTATGTTESNGSISYKYSVTIPAGATAIYICIGTKGATAKLELNTVSFQQDSNTKEVTFLIQNTSGNPITGATVAIEGFPAPLYTDATGQVKAVLSVGTNYTYTVQKDYYQIKTAILAVIASTATVPVTLSDLVEVKDVQTRISQYGDNVTPYPIYGHFWNSGLNFTPTMNQKIVNNFDYIIGGGDVSGIKNSSLNVNTLKAIDDKFQVINYQGGWSQKASSLTNQEMNLLYYRVGTLNTAISAATTSIVINAPSDNKGKGLVASEANNFTTWIRIGGELMKLTFVSSKTIYPITVTVERGLAGTTAVDHAVNATVTAPLYTTIPVEGGNNSNLSYFDPVFGPRLNRMKKSAIDNALLYNQDGIWIDILVGLLDAKSMVGGTYTLWNHDKEQVFSSIDINLKTKDAMKDIYNGFYARLGYYPVIYGNNVLYDQSYTTSSRGYIMEKTTEHPRGLDGFCHENSWGHMSDDSGAIDNDGNPVSTTDIFRVLSKYNNGRFLEWYMGNTWINNCKAIALLAQRELPNQPMTINAGFKNQWFAYDLTNQQRYDFNKYSYASYLLSVHVNSQNKISSRMGISPMTVDVSGNIDVTVEPFFTYDIGVPTQTNTYTNFTNYRVGSQNLYARKFSKGLVLVNPFSSNMTQTVLISDITGSTTEVYLDPENSNQVVTAVQLNSRESKLLLKATSLSTVENLVNPKVVLYPNPATEVLSLKFSENINPFSESETIEVYNLNGALVQKTQNRMLNNTVHLNISSLESGTYLIKVKGVKEVLKFIKI
ncbi:T9SS type A sorting domain-containing protein [Flavobacterium nackdongense]|uniref:T9SS type A sorting domain-containing protein n=1 Tax=Flavobacterium nackdongense TaxID=2547394 RepID=A0A4P6YHX1_9FLAO|nr:T9SS type A sorting domain-containing protein [Flavobacterium nackdongense]QBN20495.1 T9SS type A sorting domain-containing protein [Flavobacterium nackdongense]